MVEQLNNLNMPKKSAFFSAERKRSEQEGSVDDSDSASGKSSAPDFVIEQEPQPISYKLEELECPKVKLNLRSDYDNSSSEQSSVVSGLRLKPMEEKTFVVHNGETKQLFENVKFATSNKNCFDKDSALRSK